MTRGRASFELEPLVTLVTETSLESADESTLRFVLGDFLACIAAGSGTNERADTSPRYSTMLAQKWNRLLGESGAAEQLHFEASAVLAVGGQRARRELEPVA